MRPRSPKLAVSAVSHRAPSAACRSSAALLPACALAGLGLIWSPSAAQAAPCAVPETGHLTIQSAINDARCTEIDLKAQIYTEQINVNRAGRPVTLRGLGAGRTVLASPLRRNRSTVSTTFLRNYVYVVQVAPGSTLTLADLTVDGGGNARCTEPYFGLRAHNATLNLDAVVVENVRGRGTNFACANVFALGVTAEGTGAASLSLSRATVRGFQQAGILARGSNAKLSLGDTLIRGVGEQNQQAQTGIWVRDGATAALDRATVRDLRFTGDPCKGLGTGVRFSAAAASTTTASVLLGCDRGIELSKNSAAIDIKGNRFVDNFAGVFASQDSAGASRIVQNGFVGTRRSTATNVAMCFADSGDAIAIKGEKDALVQGNSAADSARCAIELLAGTSNLDVQENQSVRSARVDIEDAGSGNRLAKNLCLSSTPAGLCTGTP